MRTGRALLLLPAAVAVAAPAIARELTLVDLGEVPAAVLRAASCDGAGRRFALREAFGGGVLFRIGCPSNNQNEVESLVGADDAQGSDPVLLVFPDGGGGSAEIANVRVFPGARAIGEIAVDAEHDPGRPCRTERLFRLDGWRPRLVFERSLDSCDDDGAGGWTVVRDERTPAERTLSWD